MEELHRRGQPALAEEYRQLWSILCGGLEQCAAQLEDTPMELEEFAALFRLVLSQYDVGSIPVSLDRVTAGETTRQTGHPVQVLFFLGADDQALAVGMDRGRRQVAVRLELLRKNLNKTGRGQAIALYSFLE